MEIFEKLKKVFKIYNFSGVIILADGTEVQSSGDATVGAKVTVNLPDATDPVILPDGEYPMEDGQTMIVKDGEIVEIIEAPAEEEVVEEAEVEPVEEAAVEPVVEPTEEEPEVEVEAEPSDLEKRITELEAKIAELETLINAKGEKMSALDSEFSILKEKIETVNGAKKVINTPKVNLPLTEDEKFEQRYRMLKNR